VALKYNTEILLFLKFIYILNSLVNSDYFRNNENLCPIRFLFRRIRPTINLDVSIFKPNNFLFLGNNDDDDNSLFLNLNINLNKRLRVFTPFTPSTQTKKYN